MTPRLLRIKDVIHLTGMSQTWIYAQMARKNFPQPTKVGKAAVRWSYEEICSWVEQQLNKREVA